MSVADKMQEFKYCRDGATLLISLEGLNWLSKQRCGDKRTRKRDEELQLLISTGPVSEADEKQHPITCLCVLDKSAAPEIWRKNPHCRSSLETWPPPFPNPNRQGLPEELSLQSTCTSLAPFFPEATAEGLWTRLISDIQELFSFIKEHLNIISLEDVIKMYDRFIILFDKDVPQELFGDICYTEDFGATIEDTGWLIRDKSLLSDVKNFTANFPRNTKNSNKQEMCIKDSSSTRNLKWDSCKICRASGASSEKDKVVKRRKSVSFDEDVMVYLFDQESPTLELHAGPCTSLPSSSSNNLPDDEIEDIGLEWEDDFSALEKNCHFQNVGHSQHFIFPLLTESCTSPSRPERFSLPQSCLFLTHVAESDL